MRKLYCCIIVRCDAVWCDMMSRVNAWCIEVEIGMICCEVENMYVICGHATKFVFNQRRQYIGS